MGYFFIFLKYFFWNRKRLSVKMIAEITINCNNSSSGSMPINKAFFLKKIESDKENIAIRL